MNECLIIVGLALHALSGVPGLWLSPVDARGQRIATAMAIVGSLAGLAGALWSWWLPTPAGHLLRVDGIAVVFLIPIFLTAGLGAIYGMEYWSQARHPHNGRKLRLFYGLVTAALAGVAISANTLLFLTSWEVMALSAFFLVTTEDETRKVREAGWIYLITTHLSTLSLFALFALLRVATGSYALGPLPADAVSAGMASALFLLSLTAFGCKAGLMPLHIWLPGAHAMAPSHVSALMSGVLIKIGIYGLVRMCAWLPAPPPWWGGTLLVAGAVSGILGVVMALGQHDLKRLLAYHSIENIGIIVMGLGIALVGRSLNCADWVMLGLAGALLHVWNHGLFKALLFLSAGAVISATHTRDIDHLGGLARRMPRTAFCFALGAVAICGLPPLNGFVSELLIYLGAFRSLGIGQAVSWSGTALVAPTLALIGALAVACFVKAFGTVFLGAARSRHAEHASEVGPAMTGPMAVLAGCCLFIGLAPALVAPVLEQAAHVWLPSSAPPPTLLTLAPLGWISVTGLILTGLIGLASAGLLGRVRRGGAVQAITWDCGYAAPTPRMQYTASSFAQMLGVMFRWVQRPRVHSPGEWPVFAGSSRFRSHALDIVLDAALKPAFRLSARLLHALRILQAGNIQVYLFYIVLFLMLLLLWK